LIKKKEQKTKYQENLIGTIFKKRNKF